MKYKIQSKVIPSSLAVLFLVFIVYGYLCSSLLILSIAGLLAIMLGFLASILYSRALRAEEQSRRSKEYLESFINHTTDAIGLFDLDGKLVHVNKASELIFGYTVEEQIGKDVQTLPNEDYREEVRAMHRHLRRGGDISGFQTVRKRKDGRLVDVSISYTPIRDREGNVVAFANILRDISEQKRTEELLRNTEKLSLIGELAAGVAHEIRNPLTSLRGFVQLMNEEKASKYSVYYGIMLEELDRINFIVTELLMLGKPQADHYKQKHPKRLVEELTRLFGPEALLHNVQIFTEFAENLPLIKCEETQIKQVFLNLLKNSVEAMPGGGMVMIKVFPVGSNQVMFRFIDQGSGIPEEMLPRLGEPFYTTKEKGTGLGLLVSFKIIKYHQGSVKIDSVVNKGTTIDIILPISF
ncbi:PAS domain-containing sensor histidine kinase [Tumebacillus lipolyticus]|uniref:histidine kinase n=1 Tax=Tumebacillus lipolyticus TaxID=1280370 RepID=A0ABW4ZXI5_9BACL